jgi:hypothetical protein
MPLGSLVNPLEGGAGPTTGQLSTGTLYGLNGQTITGNSSGAWAVTANGTNQSITLTPSGTGPVTIGSGPLTFTASNGSASASSQINFRANNGTDTVGMRLSGGTNDFGFSGGTIYPGTYSFFTAASAGLRIAATGNALFGLTTDGTGLIQLATGTTSAGGITLGDINQFRSDVNTLTFNFSGTLSTLKTAENGTSRAQFATNAGDLFIDTLTAGKSITLRSGNQSTALTLDSSQNGSAAGKWAFNGATVSSSTAIITTAGTTSVSSLRIPHGSAPTSPVNGDIWTTTSGLFVRINGVTVGPLS